MGWRRRKRARPSRCSRREYHRAHDRGTAAFAAYLKACGLPLGVTARRRKK